MKNTSNKIKKPLNVMKPKGGSVYIEAATRRFWQIQLYWHDASSGEISFGEASKVLRGIKDDKLLPQRLRDAAKNLLGELIRNTPNKAPINKLSINEKVIAYVPKRR